MSLFGWPESWFDKDGSPKVGETLIKYYVNRYFDWPEDWDEDDEPLIMFFIKCRLCNDVQQSYRRESRLNFIYNSFGMQYFYEKAQENFIYNGDNTYTSLYPEIKCSKCNLSWNFMIEYFWNHQSPRLTEIYQNIIPRFDSPLEEYFWRSWKTLCPIALIPQYPVGRYRIDFAHLPTKTAVELDGRESHNTPYQKISDLRRQKEIEQQGWRFIRFAGWHIFENAEGCIVNILEFLSHS